MDWKPAKDITKEIKLLVKLLDFHHIDAKKITCFRSFGSTSKARARIWSFPKVWQLALNLPPHYVIEVISKNFDQLSAREKKKILIHELLHIPKNFSGSLLPHKGRFTRINSRIVDKLYKKIEKGGEC